MNETGGMTNRKFVGILFLRALFGMCLVTALAFAVDAAILRYRAATQRGAFGIVSVRPYYAVAQKDHKIEYMFDEPRDETCAHSLFPQMGCPPCWYLRRHREQEIPI